MEAETRSSPAPSGTASDLMRRADIALYRAKDSGISGPMQQAIGQTLAAGQQVLVFLNRRGFARHCFAMIAAGCPNARVAMLE